LNNDAPSLSTQQPSMIGVPKRNDLGREKFGKAMILPSQNLSANRQVGKWASRKG
jgi:hypothetical protein